MKTVFVISIIVLSIVNQESYNDILSGLSLNYVLLYDKIEHDLYFEHFGGDIKKYEEDVRIYNNSIHEFYISKKEIIDSLLLYENDTIHICTWVKTKNPYASKIIKNDFLNNSEGALVLIDNYLLNNGDIKIPSYIDNISYQKFNIFYKKYGHLDIKTLRNKYKSFIKKDYK